MRAAPALQVSLQRFGVWRGAVWGLAALAFITLAAWVITHERPHEPLIEVGVWVSAALAAAAIAALAASTARMPPLDLRWDGRAWHLGPVRGDRVPGDLSVAIDLGAWMLLRFTASVPARPRVVWLPLQRWGIESQWHALRCAVYSPRPAPDDDAAEDG